MPEGAVTTDTFTCTIGLSLNGDVELCTECNKKQFRVLPIELFRQGVGLFLAGLKRPPSLTTVQSDVYWSRRLRNFLIELFREEKADQRNRREEIPRLGVVDFHALQVL